MDRRQLIVQRANEMFADRLDDVLHMVRQDRQELRGWEEPAHLRAILRRTIREGGAPREDSTVAVTELEFGRGAAEPERGQQREGIGMLLEGAAAALEKVARRATNDLSNEELLGLECVLLLYGRPALLVDQGRLASVPPLWNLLEDQREDVELVQRGVGRIELFGHPEFDWAGTGFLVGETVLMTTRRTSEIFSESRNGRWEFRPGISAWMEYRSYQDVQRAGYRVRSVLGVHERYDLALLEVEPPQVNGSAPVPLPLAGRSPDRLDSRPVYMIGYPVRDGRRNEPERITRVFRDVYNVKRVQPGQLRGSFRFQEVELLQHDCGPLGQSSGACVVDLETHQVLGLQLGGRYLEKSTAIPLWVLREDPLLQRFGISFTETSSRDREQIVEQIERLSRTRYWAEVRNTIQSLYQRAFGNQPPR